MISYSFIDPSENIGIPPPQRYAGLYSSDQPYTNTKWSKDYRGPRIEPDAVEYAKKFSDGAKGHIPTSIRPGNNTIKNNPYSFSSTSYNSMCYAPFVVKSDK
jgi:hypothetical protein